MLSPGNGHGSGRRAELTPEIHAAIVAAVRGGSRLRTAAALAEIDYETVREWLKRGKGEASGTYRRFATDVRRAQAEVEVACVAVLYQAARRDGHLALKFLERRFPKRWGPPHIRKRTVRVQWPDPVPPPRPEVLWRFC